MALLAPAMDLISQNYKWLFDGVLGAALLTFATWALQRKGSRSESDHNTITAGSGKNALVAGSAFASGSNINQTIIHAAPGSPAQQVFHSDPTPAKILDRIDRTLPFNRDTMISSFRGLPVRWKARLMLAQALKETADIYDLTFKPDAQNSTQWIRCRTTVSSTPHLKIADHNDLWELCGYIDHIALDGSGIILKDVNFSYLGSQPRSNGCEFSRDMKPRPRSAWG